MRRQLPLHKNVYEAKSVSTAGNFHTLTLSGRLFSWCSGDAHWLL